MVYLLRHAQSRPDQFLPESEWPLSERGRFQARSLIPLLDRLGLEALYSSPYRRALETIRPFGDSSGLSVAIEDDLREKKLSPGMVQNFEALVRRGWHDLDFALPGCESSRCCQERVLNTVRSLASRHGGADILVSSHGNAIGLLVNALDPGFGFPEWRALPSPALLRLTFEDARLGWDSHFKPPLSLPI